MGLSMAPAISQQLGDKVCENIPNTERCNIIMDDAMVLPRKEQYF